MELDDLETLSCLRRIASGIAVSSMAQEDLLQEALVHLWSEEHRTPGQCDAWYLQSCRLHLKNLRRIGRSIDSPKRLMREVAPTLSDEESLPDAADSLLWTDVVVAEVSAHDMVSILSRRLPPQESEVLRLLTDGFSGREVARLLRLSHTSINRMRQHIATVARELGIQPNLDARTPTPMPESLPRRCRPMAPS